MIDHDLNYKHLRYLWLVAREGSVVAAARVCGVEQSAVSVQLRRLERHFGAKLFEKAGRRLRLSEAGKVAFGYADDIFRLGQELEQAVRHGAAPTRPAVVTVGITDAIPKLIVYKLLEPVYALPDPVRLVCVEDEPARLLAELALHNLDLVLADAAVAAPRMKVFQHPLGECGVAVFAAGGLAERLRAGFPRSLDGAPFLLPSSGSALGRSLHHWFGATGVRPDVRGEFADTALMKVFGQAGRGVFVLPAVIAAEVVRQYGVQVVGRIDAVRERYFAYTAERKLTHPAVVAVRDAARQELFPPGE